MNTKYIEDFLTVPGITGIALLREQTPLVFYGNHSGFNACEKANLFQGILQVVETIPPEFERIKF